MTHARFPGIPPYFPSITYLFRQRKLSREWMNDDDGTRDTTGHFGSHFPVLFVEAKRALTSRDTQQSSVRVRTYKEGSLLRLRVGYTYY